MAFTTDEESKLREIIEAFNNGKRLSDLPNVSGTNPFDLLCEVLDTDGESKKAALASLLPYVEEQCSYGVQFDTAVSSPACTRIGNTDLHKSVPIQNRMKGCLLDDSGKVVDYLDPKDWTGQSRDGSRGQVMVEIPMHYRKFETDGTVRRVRMSEYPLPGYHQVPQMYISAYEASVDRTNLKLCSVANKTAQYRGGNNNDDWDGTYRSLLGLPATSISRTNFRNYARKRNNSATAEWNCMTYNAHKALYWLFVVEYATLNSQAAFNAELTAEGYHQGGLGAGVTDINSTKWSEFNSYNPFIPCGYTDSLGNGTGVVEFSMPTEYDTTVKKVSVPRYRGIENPFGHLWQWTDGINVQIEPGDDGLSKVFVSDDPAKFSDSGYDGYSHVGNEARTEGYVKSVIFGEGGEIMPDAVGGGSTTYFCDYHYTSIPASTTLRGVLFGGSAYSGAFAGFAFARSSNAPSYTDAHVGSRLCFLPQSA